jgi:hypothetical protein
MLWWQNQWHSSMAAKAVWPQQRSAKAAAHVAAMSRTVRCMCARVNQSTVYDAHLLRRFEELPEGFAAVRHALLHRNANLDFEQPPAPTDATDTQSE